MSLLDALKPFAEGASAQRNNRRFYSAIVLEDAILASVMRTGRLIVADEAHGTCGTASYISAIVAERAFTALKGPVRRVTVSDVAMPFSPPLEEALRPGKTQIVQAATAAMGFGGDQLRAARLEQASQTLS